MGECIASSNEAPQWQEISTPSLSAAGPRNIRIVSPVLSVTLPESAGQGQDRWVIENTSLIPTVVRPSALNTGVTVIQPGHPTQLYQPNIGAVVVNPGETAYVYERPETWSGTLFIPEPAALQTSVNAIGIIAVAQMGGEYSGSRLGIGMRAIATLGTGRKIIRSVTGIAATATLGTRLSGDTLEMEVVVTASLGSTVRRFGNILPIEATALLRPSTRKSRSLTGLSVVTSLGGETKQSGRASGMRAIATIGISTARNNVPAPTVLFLLHSRGINATLWDAQRIGGQTSSTEQVLFLVDSSGG